MMAVSKSVNTQVIAEATSAMTSICRPVIDHVPGHVCYFTITLASSAATDGASNSSKRDFSAIATAPTRKRWNRDTAETNGYAPVKDVGSGIHGWEVRLTRGLG
jgi:hypothetical protein